MYAGVASHAVPLSRATVCCKAPGVFAEKSVVSLSIRMVRFEPSAEAVIRPSLGPARRRPRLGVLHAALIDRLLDGTRIVCGIVAHC